MPHSIFNGQLRTGPDLVVPVKLYSVVEPRPIGFRLLHASDQTPVRQRMVNPETGDEVPRDEVRKGLVLGDGADLEMVVLNDEELAELEPEPSRELEIVGFVAARALDLPWYSRPYLLGPHMGTGGDDARAYFALARALADSGTQGIVRWTMRKKHYRGALRVVDGYLVLITLRTPAQIVTARALPDRDWPKLADAELAMAGQLVEMLEADVNSTEFTEQFHDDYAQRVLALVEAKAAGNSPELPTPRSKPPTEVSLAEVLKQSLERLERERRVA